MKKEFSSTPHKIGLYVRVSTEEQASNPEGSIKSQEQRLRNHVANKNSEGLFGEVTGVFIDRAKSGKDTNRSELQRLLTAIRKKEVTLVLVTELSRLSRSIKDFCEIWQLMQSLGCGFQSLREQFDTTSAAGEMVLYTIANIAQFERRQTSERIRANFLARAERGLYNGGSVPFGYEKHAENKSVLVVSSEDAAIVQEAFSTFLREGCLAKAGKSLNERGYRLKRLRQGGGKQVRLGHFTADNLYGMLTNKAYLGLRVIRSGGEERTVKACWDAIIGESAFQKVQILLKKNYRFNKLSLPKRYPFMLSGLTVCGQCGDRLPGKSANGNGGKYPYYEHSWAMRKQAFLNKKIFSCKPHRFSATNIEERVWAVIEQILSNPELAESIISEAHEIHAKRNRLTELERLESKIKGVSEQLDALGEHLSKIPKTVSPAPIFKQMERLEEIKGALEGEKCSILQNGQSCEMPVALKDYEKFIQALKLLRTNSQEIKAKIVSKLVHKIELLPDSFKLHFYVGESHVSPEDDAKRKGTGGLSVPISNRTQIFGSNTLTNGRGDWARTSDFSVPNAARYQLRYAPISWSEYARYHNRLIGSNRLKGNGWLP